MDFGVCCALLARPFYVRRKHVISPALNFAGNCQQRLQLFRNRGPVKVTGDV